MKIIKSLHVYKGPSHVALVVKNPSVSAGGLETQVLFLGREDPLEKGIKTHSNILAWKIPWTEEPGMLYSRGLQRAGHDLKGYPGMRSQVDLRKHHYEQC